MNPSTRYKIVHKDTDLSTKVQIRSRENSIFSRKNEWSKVFDIKN